ncbi:hypothetical protein [Rhodococcus sp. T7]|uniref:hypothetical protein n=1 Tax=Rhodococcus sp. T7 TaxID=627444 RepID=UPI0013CDCE2F|nr:hypothetical protein MLGJGCBP_05458 [Rhodococcus sp. T7]
MTGMWFVLALIALAGACALLYFDRSRRDQTGRVRQIWAKAQGYTYDNVEERLPAQFHRAALAKQEYLSAIDVVKGERRGESFILFDLEETATIVAVRRRVGSDVDIDLRLKSTPPPKDSDLDLLGAIGPRVVFATDLEIARRVCDQRMVAFTESVPPHVNMLWSEGEWTLGSLPIGSSGREWDSAIEAVARLSGILHVLPPVTEPSGLDRGHHDPSRPRLRDGAPAESRPAPEKRPAPQGRPAPQARPAPQGRPTQQGRPAPQARPTSQGRPTPEPRPATPPRPAPQDRPAPPPGAPRS